MRARSQVAAVLVIAAAVAAHAAPRAARHDPAVAAALAEARTLQQSRRWAEGDSVATLALHAAERVQPPDSSAMAEALYYLANSRMGQGRVSDSSALEYVGRSLAILRRLAHPDSLDWIGAEWLLGKLLAERDQPDSALRHLAAARALCRPSVPRGDSLLGEVWLSTGRAYRRAGRADSSLACFEAGRRVFALRDGSRSSDCATALAEMGASCANLDRYDEARAHLTESVEMLEEAAGPDNPELATPLGQLASVQYLCGDIAGSIETLERVVAIRSRVDGFDSPRCIPPRHSIALRLFDFGDYAGARSRMEALLGPAEAAFGPGNTRTESVRMVAGAAAVLMGDTAAAARYLVPAHEALSRAPLDAQHLGTYVERWYSMLLQRRGDLEGAEQSIAAGLARERASGRPALPALINLLEGALEIRMARADSARVDSTLAQLASLFPDRSLEGSVLYNSAVRLRARGEAWRGRRTAAWELALYAERLERARLQLNVRALDDRRALQLAGGLAEPLDQLISLASADDTTSVVLAWDRLVRWRGLVAAEVAARRVPAIAAADTQLLASHQRFVEARRRNAQAEVAGAGASGEARARLLASRADAQDAERRYVALCAARGVGHDTSAVDLRRLRGALREDQALVSLVEVTPRTETARYVAFVTTGRQGAPRLLELCSSADLQPKLRAWRAALSVPPARGQEAEQERACRTWGAAVRATTWDLLRPAIGDTRQVVLVADGDLADLPWHALPGGPDRYLVEEGPDLEVLEAERELLWPRSGLGRGLLAVGDPDFDHAGTRPEARGDNMVVAMRGPLGACDPRGALHLQPLPGARAEVVEVARAWARAHPGEGTLPLVGERASEAAFKLEAPGREILHLATHGIVWGDSCGPVRAGVRGVGGVEPLEHSLPPAGAAPRAATAQVGAVASAPSVSPWAGRQVWLALAGANRARNGGPDENEGLLTAEEVVMLDLRGVDWVVLSACQSGAGEQWPREGSLGMRRAFRLAGARTVISSQWPIADEATREWMNALYEARARRHVAGFLATRDADRAVLAARRGSGRTTHPFYWAPFTSTGP